MDNKKISVIIPVYNADKYLDKCIPSIASQTYKDIEIILVNDGSTDKSLEIINRYAAVDNRIIVIDKANGGVSSARNMGLDNASGDYIMFIDADDFIEENMLEKMYNKLRQTEASMCICGMRVVRKLEDGSYETIRFFNYKDTQENIQDGLEKVKEEDSSKGEYIALLQINWAPFCKLMKKELVKDIRYDIDIAIAEDLMFNAKVITDNEEFKIAIVNELLYSYVDVSTSAMKSSYTTKMLVGLETEEKVYNMLKSIDIEKRLSKVLFSGVITYFFRYATATKEVKNAHIEEYKKALDIVKRNKKYLLEKRVRSRSDRIKMKLICYAPSLYLLLRKSRGL